MDYDPFRLSVIRKNVCVLEAVHLWLTIKVANGIKMSDKQKIVASLKTKVSARATYYAWTVCFMAGLGIMYSLNHGNMFSTMMIFLMSAGVLVVIEGSDHDG